MARLTDDITQARIVEHYTDKEVYQVVSNADNSVIAEFDTYAEAEDYMVEKESEEDTTSNETDTPEVGGLTLPNVRSKYGEMITSGINPQVAWNKTYGAWVQKGRAYEQYRQTS